MLCDKNDTNSSQRFIMRKEKEGETEKRGEKWEDTKRRKASERDVYEWGQKDRKTTRRKE